MPKRRKYEKILQLIKEEPIVTVEKLQRKYPEISSATFGSIMNILCKHDLVKKIPLKKRRVAYQRTDGYAIEKAKEILMAHRLKPGNSIEKKSTFSQDSRHPQDLQPKQVLKPNPVLTMALYSFLNAIELFQRKEERHRQATIILMDLAVEYALKAKLYEADSVAFIESQVEHLDFFAALREVKKIEGISREDEVKLTKVHNTRNYAQHRAVIPDSPSTRQYIVWVYEFIKRFVSENFGIDVDSQIPPSLFRALRRMMYSKLVDA